MKQSFANSSNEKKPVQTNPKQFYSYTYNATAKKKLPIVCYKEEVQDSVIWSCRYFHPLDCKLKLG